MDSSWNERVEDLGIRFGYPRIFGTYLAVNALPDVWMLVDSADCATLRSEFIQDNHDWNSTLMAMDGRHRIANTGVCPNTIIHDRRQDLAEQMTAIGQSEGTYLIPYAAPIAALVGVDYKSIYDQVKDRVGLELLPIRPVESLGDWISGYSQVLETLAQELPLPAVERDGDAVAVVGYLWDRNEADHGANLKELRRLCAGLELELTTVWLSGVPTGDLKAVARAGTIIALPYAGKAAEILAARTGARVVRTGLPVGLGGTIEWLEQLAAATGRSEVLAAWLADEAGRHYRAVSKAATRYFMNREFFVATEGYLAAAVAGMVREFGGVVRLLAGSGQMPAVDLHGQGEVYHSPPLTVLGERITALFEESSMVPVLICNEQAVGTIRTVALAGVFLGFQAPGTHYLYDTPFMGFAGALSLTDRIVNSLPVAFTLHR